MITNNIGRIACQLQFLSQTRTPLATGLGPTERKRLSLQVLTRTGPVTRLAQDYQVSRKFLYQQATKASDALDEAFMPRADDEKVLFYLPVTKDWLGQFVACWKITAIIFLPLLVFSMKGSPRSPPDSTSHCF